MFRLIKKKQEIFDENIIRKEYYFEGTVQNTGFRFEIQKRAKHLSLTGWARNNDDGSVTCQIQGKPDDINQFILDIQKINRLRFDFIGEIEIKPEPNEKSFEIQY